MTIVKELAFQIMLGIMVMVAMAVMGGIVSHPEAGILASPLLLMPLLAGLVFLPAMIWGEAAHIIRGARRWHGTPVDGLLVTADKKAIATAVEQAIEGNGWGPFAWRTSPLRHGTVEITGRGSWSGPGGISKSSVTYRITATIGDRTATVEEEHRALDSLGNLWA